METIKVEKLENAGVINGIPRYVYNFKKYILEEVNENSSSELKPYELFAVMLRTLRILEMERLGEIEEDLLLKLNLSQKQDLKKLVNDFCKIIKDKSSEGFYKEFKRMIDNYI